MNPGPERFAKDVKLLGITPLTSYEQGVIDLCDRGKLRITFTRQQLKGLYGMM